MFQGRAMSYAKSQRTSSPSEGPQGTSKQFRVQDTDIWYEENYLWIYLAWSSVIFRSPSVTNDRIPPQLDLGTKENFVVARSRDSKCVTCKLPLSFGSTSLCESGMASRILSSLSFVTAQQEDIFLSNSGKSESTKPSLGYVPSLNPSLQQIERNSLIDKA